MNCPKCGFENPEGAKFCNQCGAELFITYRRRDKGQRRRVAVLFADISGFTPLSEDMDPEEVRDLIDGCLQRLAGVIYKYEGYIDKFIGDCIMALFGAPVAHEDDPLRAAITAMDLLKEIKQFNIDKGLKLSLSIGINYGLVATGDLGRPGEYTVMVDTVNLAQRLQYAAPRGKIYASESICQHTKNEVVYKKLKKIKVKGKKELVLVYEPQRIKRQYSLRKIKELPLVGRSNELNKLSKLFSEVKTGSGRIVSVIGEAGIGKSKLIYEFKKQIVNNIYILEGRGIEYLSTSPYLVLKDILKNLLRIDENDTKDASAKKLLNFIKGTHYSSLLRIIPFLKYFLGLSLSRDNYNRFESMQPKDRVRLINEAILTLLLRISHVKPLIIIFEDCHWIDAETINFMSRLAKEIVDKRIMVINLYRPEFNVGKKTASLGYFSQINLRPLSVDDTTTLLHDLLLCKKIEDKLFKLLMKKSGCIPFYIHELTSNLLNNNIIFIESNVAKLKRGMEAAVPRTLDELVMAKIDRLSKEPRAIIDIASVIGDEFSFKLLNTLLELDDRLSSNLLLLTQKEIIQPLREEERGLSAEEKYMFSHSLMREAVYQSLLKQTRKDYHKQIGYAIETVYSDELNEYYDALANHFLLGGEKTKAEEFLEKAGDRKKELYLNKEAIAMYEQSLKLIDRSDDTRVARIYEKLGSIYDLIGQYNEAKIAYTEMGRCGKNDALIKAKSYIEMAKVLIGQGLFDQALNMLNKSRGTLQAMKRLSTPEAKIELANILRFECWFYRIKGMMDQAEKKGMEAISIIKNEKDWKDYEKLKRTLELAYIPLAIVYSIKGEYQKAIHLLEETLLIAEELGDRRGLGHAYNNLGTIFRAQGRFDQAIDSYTMKLKISQELGDKSGVGIAYCNLGNLYRVKGEYEKAIQLLESYLNITEEIGDKQGVGQAHINLGVVYYDKTEYDRAFKSFEKYLSISEELGDKRGIAGALQNLAEVYRSKFEYKRAIELLQKCLKMSEDLGDKKGVAQSSYSLGVVYTEIDDLKSAERYLNSAKEVFETIGNKIAIGRTYNSLSSLKIKQGRLADSLDVAKKALKLSKETDSTEIKIDSLLNFGEIYAQRASLSSSQKAKNFFKKSKASFEKAITLAQGLKNKRLLADTYYEYANVFWSGNKVEKNLARKNLTKALNIYKKLKLKRRIIGIEKIIKHSK